MAGKTYKHKFLFTGEDRTKQALASVKSGLNGVDKAYKAIGAGAGALGLGAIGAAVAQSVNQTAESLDELAKRSRALGMTSDQLDAWEYAAERTGVGTAEMGVALRTLSKNMYDAARGTGEGKVAFDALGISVTDNEGKLRDVTSVLLDVSDGMESYADKNAHAALSQKMFGKSGTALVNTLADGSGAIRSLLIDAHTLGTRYDGLTVKGEEYEDQQLRMNRAFRSTRDAIVVQALPGLTALAETMAGKVMDATTGLSQEYREFIGELRIAPTDIAMDMLLNKEADLQNQLSRTIGLIDKKNNKYKVKTGKSIGGMVYRKLLGSQDKAATSAHDLRNKLAALGEEKERLTRRLELIRNAQEQWEQGTRSAAASVEKLTAAERQALAIMAKAATPVEQYDTTVRDLREHLDAGRISQETYDRAVVQATENLNKANPAWVASNDLAREGAVLMENLRTPLEAYNVELAHLGQLLEAGAVSQETYARAVAQAGADYETARANAASLADTAGEAMDVTQAAGTAMARGLGSVFSDMATGAKGELKSIADYAQQVADQVLNSLIQAGIVDPLVRGIMNSGAPTAPAADFIGPPAPRASGGALMGGRSYLLGEGANPEVLLMGQHARGEAVPITGGGSEPLRIEINIQALDGAGAVEVLARNKPMIVGMIQEAYNQRGQRGPLG